MTMLKDNMRLQDNRIKFIILTTRFYIFNLILFYIFINYI